MTVLIEPSIVRLTGSCGVEDAEPLLAAIEDDPNRPIDISGLVRAHMAVAQLLIMARQPIEGSPDSAFLLEMLVPLLRDEANQSHIVGGALPL